MPELQTREEYISEMQETLAFLEKILAEFKKLPHLNTQGLLSYYFADRARKVGNACLRILDLDAPLAILCRVLCEDFINLYWVTQSPENAIYYTKRSISEMGKVTKRLFSRMIEEKKNEGENLEMNIDFDKLAPKVKTKTLKDMAKEVGLDALYDHVYRSESMSVHGHNWGIFQIELKNMELLLLSQISTLLVVTAGLFNHGHQVITPKVVLAEFGLES
jgi:Family of unknown function (DUF5677)